MADATRVALLARPGEACERLRAALREAGGDIVLEADPSTLAADALSAAAPQTVLVALDPAVEDALERFDAVLGDPNVAVIFDEADLAARREGWDAQRWVRHLSAKLHRHGDVLPPGREPDAGVAPEQEPAAEGVEDPRFSADPAPDFASGAPAPEIEAFKATAMDAASFEVIEGLPGLALEATPESAVELDAAISFDPQRLPSDAPTGFPGLALTDDIGEMTLETDMPASGFAGDAGFDALLAALEPDAAATPAREAAVDAGLDEFLASSPEVALDPVSELPALDATPEAPAPAAREPARPTFDFSALSLADLEGAAPAPAGPAPAGRFHHDIADLERRIASMGLADAPGGSVAAAPAPMALEAAPEAAPSRAAAAGEAGPASLPAAGGAVLILAGIGGPDAVRQILSALPASFTRPVLISQRLDGGRYDRLVQQMARAAALPVQLAQADAPAEAGKVYVVPPELGLGASALRFEAGAPLLAALPAEESAVLLLSGADPLHVDDALAKAAQGAMVAGQSPEGCYDAAAPVALTTRGGVAGTPSELVQRLLQRWPA